MPSNPIRSLLAIVVAVALPLAGLATPVAAAAHPHGPGDDQYTFIGGGWGHGGGLSQYGALGRAEAGFDYSEILAFYYDGTDLTTDPAMAPDDVDVRIAVRSTTVFRPSGTLTVAIDGQFLDTTVNTLTVRRGDGGWHVNSSNIDWCSGFCGGTVLTVSFTDGEVVRVSSTTNGTERYAHGQFQLTPASGGVANCGSRSANQYCLVIGDLTMQQYLYGLDEMPHNWPAAALKAQVVAARSYAVAMLRERSDWAAPFDLYTSTRDQEYMAWDFEREAGHERWAAAVDDTDDTVLTYQATDEDPAEVIVAYYGSSNGGHTAANEEPRRDPLPYLLAKPDPYDAARDAEGDPQNPTHAWTRTYTSAQITGWLAEYTFADLDVGELIEVYIAGPGPSGRIDDALVTLVGSERTLEVRNADGDPYGYRFYYALVLGCRNTPDCRPMLSTKLQLMAPHDDGYTVHTSPFADVASDAPYAPAVAWMLNNDITTGTTPTTFSPETSLTRSQFAAFLWRLAGEPEAADGALSFADAEPESYYAEAVGWMTDQNITLGCRDDPVALFCPTDQLQISQVAAFLWRFAGRPYSSHPVPFTDIGINDYYLEAARWMLEHQIWVDENYEAPDSGPAEFNPPDPVNRGRMAMFVWRLAGSPGAFDSDIEMPPLMRTP